MMNDIVGPVANPAFALLFIMGSMLDIAYVRAAARDWRERPTFEALRISQVAIFDRR